VGKPSQEVVRRANAVADALSAAIDAIRPGVRSSEVDAACRQSLQSANLAHLFLHRTGYSIGLNFPPDWGEGHILSLRAGDDTPLCPGMTFHLVPVLIDHSYGIGMSETVLVTDTGAEPLTRVERTLFVV
jgi:Xaa-Pro dipeptidase